MRFDFPVPDDPRRVLRGRLVQPLGEVPPTGAPWLLVAHGYGGHCEWGFYPELSRRLAEHGVATVRFNFSGGGIGPDLVTVEDEDVFARNTYLAEQQDLTRLRAAIHGGELPGLDPGRGAILGHSRGGAMALVHAASAGDYLGVVTWAAMSSIVRFDEDRLATWREQGWIDVMHWILERRVRLELSVLESAERHRERLDPLAAARRLTCPVLVVQGTRDRGCTEEDADAILSAVPDGQARSARIDGAGHAFGARHPLREVGPHLEQVLSATVDFAREVLNSDREG